jgi:hypothetical protein
MKKLPREIWILIFKIHKYTYTVEMLNKNLLYWRPLQRIHNDLSVYSYRFNTRQNIQLHWTWNSITKRRQFIVSSFWCVDVYHVYY